MTILNNHRSLEITRNAWIELAKRVPEEIFDTIFDIANQVGSDYVRYYLQHDLKSPRAMRFWYESGLDDAYDTERDDSPLLS